MMYIKKCSVKFVGVIFTVVLGVVLSASAVVSASAGEGRLSTEELVLDYLKGLSYVEKSKDSQRRYDFGQVVRPFLSVNTNKRYNKAFTKKDADDLFHIVSYVKGEARSLNFLSSTNVRDDEITQSIVNLANQASMQYEATRNKHAHNIEISANELIELL